MLSFVYLKKMRIISIFSRDFRLTDNSLFDGCRENEIIPLFLFDDFNQKEHGSNLKSLFFSYVKAFSKALKKLQSKLYVTDLEDFDSFLDIAKPDIVRLCFDSEPYTLKRLNDLKAKCEKRDIKFHIINQFLIPSGRETFRKTFTHFYKKVFIPYLSQNIPQLSAKPEYLITPHIIYKCKALPIIEDSKIVNLWYKDEKDVLNDYKTFLTDKLSNYGLNRDFPSIDATSKLSVYFRMGSISHRYAYLQALKHPNSEKFISEIAWSEYYRIWLYLHPDVTNLEYRENWREFPWRYSLELFEKWKNGETGFELVDAGMNQLKKEGWMHNRVRMITASFLVKNLMIDWRWGEQYFYKNLVDADMAQNVGNWQWVTGCGLDAAPYFRIFNPSLQLEKFDPERKYVSKYATNKHPQIIDFQGSKRDFLRTAEKAIRSLTDYPK